MANVIFYDYDFEAIYNSDFFILPVINREITLGTLKKTLFTNTSTILINEIVQAKLNCMCPNQVGGVLIPAEVGPVPLFIINCVKGDNVNIPLVHYSMEQIASCMNVIEGVASHRIYPFTPFLQVLKSMLVEYPTDHDGGLYIHMYQTYSTDNLTKCLEQCSYQGDINLEALPF